MKSKGPKFTLQTIMTMFLVFCFVNSAVAGRLEKRTLYVEALTEPQLEEKSLRDKIITTRSITLYLKTLLPEKGNPYSHMITFFNDSLLSEFKEAQKNSQPYMSEMLWIPDFKKYNGQISMGSADESLVNYFAKLVATLRVLKTVNAYYTKSILVEPLAVSVGSVKAMQYTRALGLLTVMVSKYEKYFVQHAELRNQVLKKKRLVYLAVIKKILSSMKPHMSLIENTSNKASIAKFMGEIKKLTQQAGETLESSSKTNNILEVKRKLVVLFGSPAGKVVESAFSSVDLPASGAIDGSEESFESVVRLEIGFGLLKNLCLQIENW